MPQQAGGGGGGGWLPLCTDDKKNVLFGAYDIGSKFARKIVICPTSSIVEADAGFPRSIHGVAVPRESDHACLFRLRIAFGAIRQHADWA